MSIVLNCIVLLVLLLISNSILTTHSCPCGDFLPRPDLWKKALTARWMSHSLDWGVLTTFSSRINTNDDGMPSMPPMPFGNVYSFIDGSCINATGTPYFYGTYMDQSFQDMKMNPYASLTLSEASLASTCLDTSSDVFVQKACVISNYPSSTNQTTSDDETYPGDPGKVFSCLLYYFFFRWTFPPLKYTFCFPFSLSRKSIMCTINIKW